MNAGNIYLRLEKGDLCFHCIYCRVYTFTLAVCSEQNYEEFEPGRKVPADCVGKKLKKEEEFDVKKN